VERIDRVLIQVTVPAFSQRGLRYHRVPPTRVPRSRLETRTSGIRDRSDNYSSSTFRLELSDCSVNTDDDMGVTIWSTYLLQTTRDLHVSAYRVAGADLVSRLTDCLLNKLLLVPVCLDSNSAHNLPTG
jgi:hypothetical protein